MSSRGWVWVREVVVCGRIVFNQAGGRVRPRFCKAALNEQTRGSTAHPSNGTHASPKFEFHAHTNSHTMLYSAHTPARTQASTRTHSHTLTPTHTHCHALSHTYTLSAQCMSCRQRVLSSFLLFTHTRTCPRHNSCWSWQILYGGIRISLWGTFRRMQLLVSSSSPSSRSDYVYCGCSHYCRTASTAKLACR